MSMKASMGQGAGLIHDIRLRRKLHPNCKAGRGNSETMEEAITALPHVVALKSEKRPSAF
jgi:hypothetical protein